MRQLILIFLIYAGLLFSSCNSNKKSTSFGKKNSSIKGAPGTHKASADTDKVNKKPLAKTNDPVRPNNSAMGPGTGGSYASYHYHYRNLNKKKASNAVSDTTIAQKSQTYQNVQADTLNIKADSIDYADNSW